MSIDLTLASDFDQCAKGDGNNDNTAELVRFIDNAFAHAMQDNDRFNGPVHSSGGEGLNLSYDVPEADLDVSEVE